MSCTILITGDVPTRISRMERANGGSNGVSFEHVVDTAELESWLEHRDGSTLMVVAGPGTDGEQLEALRAKHPDVPFVLEADAPPPPAAGDQSLATVIERYSEMRTDFLARLSHEVRSPLGVIVGVLGELEATLDVDEDTKQLLRLADRGVRRLRNLSEGLMEVAELESLTDEPLSVDRQPCDVRDVVRSAVERTQATESRSSVTVEIDVPDEPVQAELDARRIERVVSALVSNAIRFGQKRVGVSVKDGGDSVRIDVEDDGPGIPMSMREDVFRRFVGQHLHGRKAGVAFGLSIASDYVEAHGGEIAIADARPDALEGENRGARVTVTLPRGGAGGS